LRGQLAYLIQASKLVLSSFHVSRTSEGAVSWIVERSH
jgi:hypothetical protein